ncbi:hypothetical protein HY502_01535 [Candidatus Woesebacteria bacterium]|nr:hypothetical protein [Candidatus Woesebacteria bacterium]
MTLTDKDLKNIKELMEVTIVEKLDAAIENEIATKSDLSHLPTKEEFFSRTDETMGELKAMREEHIVASGQISDHEDRIVRLEQKTGLTTSS